MQPLNSAIQAARKFASLASHRSDDWRGINKCFEAFEGAVSEVVYQLKVYRTNFSYAHAEELLTVLNFNGFYGSDDEGRLH